MRDCGVFDLCPQKFNPSAGDSMFSNARMMYARNSGTAPTSKESTYDACNNDQSGYIQRQQNECHWERDYDKYESSLVSFK